MEKSQWMMVAILAVWKSGAAYVPIDPTYPKERMQFMLTDTKAHLVLTSDTLIATRLQLFGVPVVEITSAHLFSQPIENPQTDVLSTDLAYAIYTSGTTGNPKAVLVEHRGVVNLQISLAKIFSLCGNQQEVLLSFSNYVFDHFVEQMLDALLNGQKLVVLNDAMRSDHARLYKYINDNVVTYLSGTPSVLSLYNFSSTPSIQRIDAIGEDFTEPVFNKIRATFSGTIINGYGPTEISITSHKRLYEVDQHRTNKSIGFPVANTTCYVLNNSMKRVPIGAIGELYIGGIGVARGYLNRDDLTLQRFVNNPFQSESEDLQAHNSRVYKTGDLVRWLPNGEVEYLGRNDMQVKIRGQRVELAEIQAVLSSYPEIQQSVVIARKHKEGSQLVGFYVSNSALVEDDIKQWMRHKLTETLVPSHVIRIPEVPVTINGKLDVRNLPQTEFDLPVDYVAPVSDIEVKLCGIWAKVLGVAPGVCHSRDFFYLGGDSLRTIELIHAISTIFNLRIGVGSVSLHCTIAAQARLIQTAHEQQIYKTVQTSVLDQTRAPVSLAQERLLFIHRFEGGTASYNIPFVLKTATKLYDIVKQSLYTLLWRHPALRTLLEESNGSLYQHVLDTQAAAIIFDLIEQTVDSQNTLDVVLSNEADHVFCLDRELPIRAGFFRVADNDTELYLSMVVHHTCFDGWSWGIFQKELTALISSGNEFALSPIPYSYIDFAVHQRDHLTGSTIASLSQFWKANLADFDNLNLPLDFSRPSQFNYFGRELLFEIDSSVTGVLKTLARRARVTLFPVLAAAYILMLRAFSNQDDIIIGTPMVNRGWPELTPVIGFFANLVALRTKVASSATVMEYIQSVGTTVTQAQVHQEYPFEQLVKALGIENNASRHPIVQVIFSLLDSATFGDTNSEFTTYKPNNNGKTTAKYDLSVTMCETSTGLSGNITYATSLFTEDTILSFVECYKQILFEFARASDTTKICEIQLVRGASLLPNRALLSADREYIPLNRIFEAVVSEVPNKVCFNTQQQQNS